MVGLETAGDLMHTEPVAVRPETPLKQVARTMAAHHLKVLPVLDDDDRLVGILTAADLVTLRHRDPSRALPCGHYLG
jgi:CBS domain-containing protein